MHISPNRWQAGVAIALLTLAIGPAVRRANADGWDKRTILTVNQPIEIANTVLQPGKYVLTLPTGNSDRHTVEVFNADQTHLIETVLTIPAQRLQVTGKTVFTYWETPAGTAKALRDWYYPGDNFGQQFPYPKHPQELALLEKPAGTAVTTSSSTATETAQATQPPAEPAAQQPATPPPTTAPDESQQTPTTPTTTDNTQQPAAQAPVNPEPVPSLTQGTADRAAELPKTGSNYPLLGIAGVLLLGFAGLLKVLRPDVD